jgi:O-antigen ligase
MTKLDSKINTTLKLLIFILPILIIIGPFAINSFAVIFSLYGLANYKVFIKNNIFNKKIIFFFFSFLILIFPYESINFQNSILKYLAFSRFILMLFGLIIFFNKQNDNKKNFSNLYKAYTIYLIIISIDVLIEQFYGSNILGYSTDYTGRIASFTNDELIIGYIVSFLFIFSSASIYKKTNYKYFFIILSFIFVVSFFIGERSNFIKLFLLMIAFYLISLIYFEKLKFKNFLLIIPIILILFSSIYEITKNTPQGKKLYDIDELRQKFYDSKHAPHYFTAYNIFLNYPILGIGINNFYQESSKSEYEDTKLLNTKGRVSNHPHQIYLEIISEVGLIGSIYFFFIIFYPINISIKYLIKRKNSFVLSHLLLHIFFVMPIIPSGSFFGTNYGIPFWFNLSILLFLSRKEIKN